MSISATLSKFLAKNQVPHIIYEHPPTTDLHKAASRHGVEIRQALDVQVLIAKEYKLLVVYPLNRRVDFGLLSQQLHADFSFMDKLLVNKIFRDCEAGIKLPFGYPYNLDVLVDKSIEDAPKVYFNGGGYTSLVEMSLTDFFFLNAGCLRLNFTKEVDAMTDKAPSKNLKKRWPMEDYNLPEAPSIISKILELSFSSDKNSEDLAQLLASANDFSQQIVASLNFSSLSNARLADNYLDKFRNFSDVAIGVSAAEVLADLKDFWLHAFMAGALAEILSKQVTTIELNPMISYLGGIFHNIGFVLLGKLFPPEFKLLQKWQYANPDIPIQILERKLLGMGKALQIVRGGHARLGEWLLRSWKMPEEICVIAGQHHNLNYSDKYAPYVKILQIANHLLKCHGIGDGSNLKLKPLLLESLGLTQKIVDDSLADVLSKAHYIENLAQAITR